MGNHSIKDGRSIADRGMGFMPNLPDCLGYILGFSLIWLVYTGFGPVLGIIRDPHSVLSSVREEVREVKQIVAAVPQPAPEKVMPTPIAVISSALSGDGLHKEEISQAISRWMSLDGINANISKATQAIPNLIDGIMSGEEDEKSNSKKDKKKLTDTDVVKGDKDKEPDSLEYFR
jgi:hypothetical protein